MPMSHNGLVKLSEECAEVIQVAQKLVAYPNLQYESTERHPDGTFLLERLTEEIADAMAAFTFVIVKLSLNKDIVRERYHQKLSRFKQWDLDRND